MPTTPRMDANPAILEWARNEAGYSLDEAAKRIDVTAERLAAWELGDDRPTLAQLRKASDTYARTVASFLLAAPPPSDLPAVRDFRSLSTSRISPQLRREMRRAVRRRQVLLDLALIEPWALRSIVGIGADERGGSLGHRQRGGSRTHRRHAGTDERTWHCRPQPHDPKRCDGVECQMGQLQRARQA